MARGKKKNDSFLKRIFTIFGGHEFMSIAENAVTCFF